MKVKSDLGRFAIVPLWILESNISSSAIRLFAVMAAKYADRESGTLYPSRKQLAADIGAKSPRTIDKLLDELVGLGSLYIEHRQDASRSPTSNLYTLHFIALPHADNCTPLAENCESPLADNSESPSSRKLPTEPKGLLEPESIEPVPLLNIDHFPEWFKTLSQDPRWHGNDPKRYIKSIEDTYAGLNLDLEAHSAYEWLQSPKGQKKKVLRGFWTGWLKRTLAQTEVGRDTNGTSQQGRTQELSALAKYGNRSTQT